VNKKQRRKETPYSRTWDDALHQLFPTMGFFSQLKGGNDQSFRYSGGCHQGERDEQLGKGLGKVAKLHPKKLRMAFDSSNSRLKQG
jgi:hypothetical protein